MRGDRDPRRPQEPVARRQRLLRQHVESRREKAAGVEGVAHRVVVDELAARAVDEHGALRHERERVGVDHPAVFRRDARMDRDDVAAGEKLAEGIDVGHPFGRLARPRVVDEHTRPEGGHDGGDPPSDGAVSDDADGRGADLRADVVENVIVRAPLAVDDLPVALGDLPEAGEDHPHGVLGRRRRVAARRVGDEHPGPSGGLDVDVDGAAPANGDELERGRGRDDLLREGEGVGEGDVAAAEGFDQLVLVAGRLADVADVSEGRDGPRRGDRGRFDVGKRMGEGGAQDGVGHEAVGGEEDFHDSAFPVDERSFRSVRQQRRAPSRAS